MSQPPLLWKIGASFTLTLVLLAIVEFVAGFFVAPMVAQEIPGDAVSRTVTYIEVNPAPLERDVELLWRNVPGARKTQPVNPRAFGRNDMWTIENNSLGYRGPELLDVNTGERPYRIVCVGDSITFGFSVDQPDTYPQQLARVLSERYPGRRFEIVNAGVPGWSWMQGLRFLDLRADALDPDLVIIGHGTNDQLFPSKFTDEERFLRLGSPLSRAKQRVAIFAAETNLFRAISRTLPPRAIDAPSPGCQQQIQQSGGCRRVSLDQIAQAVQEVGRLAAGRGTALLVVNTDFVQTAAVQGVRRGVEAASIPFVDLVAELMARRQKDEEERAVRLGLAPATNPPPYEARPGSDSHKSVTLRVLVPDPRESYRVEGLAYFHPEFTFAQPLRDDGAAGDEKAGDGVFTTVVEVPVQYPALEYKYHQRDKAEFAALPPLSSALGDRVLPSPSTRVGPVDVFGQSLFMVERAHPNRDGHAVIAALIADKLQTVAAFHDNKGATR